VRSAAILFGRADRIVVALLQLGGLALLAVVGHLSALGRWFWLGLAMAAVLALWQQRLIRDREPSACFRAFLNNNYFGMAVFATSRLSSLKRTFRSRATLKWAHQVQTRARRGKVDSPSRSTRIRGPVRCSGNPAA
jgi:hypothetical protein